MQNGLKLFFMAASTVITCIVVGIWFTTAKQAYQVAELAASEYSALENMIATHGLSKYDERVVYGYEVVNYLRQNIGSQTSLIPVAVISTKGGSEQTVIYDSKEDIEAAGSIDSVYYIRPTGQYYCSVKENKNGMITAVDFSEQTEKI